MSGDPAARPVSARGLRPLWWMLTPVVFFTLACGALWREVQARTFSELSIDLQEWIDLDDPHREEVQQLIDEGWMAAFEGRVGLTAAVPFEVAFERAAADREFDELELEELRTKARPFFLDSPGVSRRARLLSLKQQMDAEVRVERHTVVRRRGRTVGDGARLSDWLLPDDLSDAAESAGWEIDGICRDDLIDGIQFVSCDAQKGPLVARVGMNRYPTEDEAREAAEKVPETDASHQEGDTLLTVSVIDGTAGEALRNAIVAKGDRLGKLSAGPMQAAIKGGGWELDGCDAIREGSLISVTCEAHQHGRQALVVLEVVRGADADPAEEQRVVSAGEASVLQGRNQLTATVSDRTPAQELADAMLLD